MLEEDRSGRVRWENPKLCASLRMTGTSKKGKPPPLVRDALNGEPAPTGEAAVGWRIGVWWRDDACYYKGGIELYSAESGKATACHKSPWRIIPTPQMTKVALL